TSGTSPSSNTYATDWKRDTTVFGSNNSIYHRLFNAGFTEIDSFNRPRAFIFAYQKGDKQSFTPKWVFSQDVFDRITLAGDYSIHDTIGYITSPKMGPAKAWKQVHWRGTSQESNSPDNPTIDVIGINPSD